MSVSIIEIIANAVIGAVDQTVLEFKKEQEMIRFRKRRRRRKIVICVVAILMIPAILICCNLR